ncbi:MAG TPA: hypothetical protein DCR07_00520 [Lactococcus sp.]|nr:hypothetical protein [Lactococcus sp.]
MNYLNSRPNSHGLLSETDAPIVLNKVAKTVADHSDTKWTHVVSLKREDSERMGILIRALASACLASHIRHN